MSAPTIASLSHGDFDDCGCERCHRARIAWRQRDQLERIARRRTNSWVDAEDAAQEAIVRALEARELDREHIPAWLTRVAVNLCADLGRDQQRHPKRVRYQVMQEASHADVETVVIDRAVARQVYRQAAALPPAQRAAILMKAEGRSVTEVAEALAISTKAAESLLSRARATLRRAAGLAVAVLAVVRRSRRTAPQLAATATAVSSLFVLGAVIGAGHSSHAATTPPLTRPDAVTIALKPSSAVARSHPITRRRSTPALAAAKPVARQHLLGPHEVAVGPARVHDGGAGWSHVDEPYLQSVQSCVSDGVVVSADYVGCRSAADHKTKDGRLPGVKQA